MRRSTTNIAKYLAVEQKAILEQIWTAWENPRHAPEKVMRKVKSKFLNHDKDYENLQNTITIKGIAWIHSNKITIDQFLNETLKPHSEFMKAACEDWFLASYKTSRIDTAIAGSKDEKHIVVISIRELDTKKKILEYDMETYGYNDAFALTRIVNTYKSFLRETLRLSKKEIQSEFQDPHSERSMECLEILHRHIIRMEDSGKILRTITNKYCDTLDEPHPRWIWDSMPRGMQIVEKTHLPRLEAFARKQQIQEIMCGTTSLDLNGQMQDPDSLFWKKTAFKTRDSLICEHKIDLDLEHEKSLLDQASEIIRNEDKFLDLDIRDHNCRETQDLAVLYLLHEEYMKEVYDSTSKQVKSACENPISYDRYIIRRQCSIRQIPGGVCEA